MKIIKICILGIALVISLSGIAGAADVTIPNVFTANTPAKADSVNENFAVLELAVDDNSSVISSLQSAYLATEYYSVSTTAFIPFQKTYDYHIAWDSVSSVGGGIFYAPVNLPDGAVVTSFEVILSDHDATEDITVHLYKRGIGSSLDLNSMATVMSSGSTGRASYSDTSIDFSVIDNLNNHYLFWLGLDSSSMGYYGAVIGFHRTLN